MSKIYVEKVDDEYSNDPLCDRCIIPIEADYLVWDTDKERNPTGGAEGYCTTHFLDWVKENNWLPEVIR